MALTKVFLPWALSLPEGPTVYITHLQGVTADRQYQLQRQASSGDIGPCFIGTTQSDPQMTFQSTQLKEVFTGVKAGSQNFIRDYSAGNVEMFYIAAKENDFRYAEGDVEHIKATLTNNATLYWDNLNVRQGEWAELSGTLMTSGTAPGTDALIISATNLTGVPAACNNLYTLGPVYLNGSQIFGITNVSWQNNPNPININADGDTSTTFFGMRSMQPVITLTSHDVASIAAASDGGDALTGDGLVIYLRRANNTNYHFADGTTNHIKLQAQQGLIIENPISNDPTDKSITVHVAKNTPAFYSIDLDVIIP